VNIALTRFNHHMNIEFMSSTHGTSVSMEELESMALRSMLYALSGSETPDLNSEIKVFDIINLIEDLDHQGKLALAENA
jgi:hypothetical protein